MHGRHPSFLRNISRVRNISAANRKKRFGPAAQHLGSGYNKFA
jgi:hypothetical protein